MYYKWLGKTVKCENLNIQLTGVLSERCVEDLGECVIVADGKIRGDSKLERDGKLKDPNGSMVVRMRVQYISLVPKLIAYIY
jgi:hypothetical protein